MIHKEKVDVYKGKNNLYLEGERFLLRVINVSCIIDFKVVEGNDFVIDLNETKVSRLEPWNADFEFNETCIECEDVEITVWNDGDKSVLIGYLDSIPYGEIKAISGDGEYLYSIKNTHHLGIDFDDPIVGVNEETNKGYVITNTKSCISSSISGDELHHMFDTGKLRPATTIF